MYNVGVLALQGSVIEHINSLSQLDNVSVIQVKEKQDLKKIMGLIIPGGESTTQGKLLRDFGLLEPIVKRAKEGMPVWGTCAGMVLMANKIIEENTVHLGIMNISVKRNAYGSQLNSFTMKREIPQISKEEIPLVFIRAPWIEKTGEGVEVLAVLENKIIAAQQDNMMVTSFHPELTKDLHFHKYFVEIIKKYN